MHTTKGKHKRGNSGSTEEEANASKRVDMAAARSDPEDRATFEDENLETTNEPTRKNLVY